MKYLGELEHMSFWSAPKWHGLIILAAVVTGLPSAVLAQAVLEEIIVTAERREASLQDSPLAVSAFTGEELERRGVVNTVSLGHLVPNLTIGEEGIRDATIVAIRGISQTETRAVDDPTTAFAIDGATVPNMGSINSFFYDVERMEVLRGPQGTLWGQNSTSGVVNIITKKPELDAVGGDIEVGYGDYNAVSAKGALNIPFSSTFGARVAFNYLERDGYRENGPLVDSGDDADDFGIRGHMLWDSGDSTSILLTADYYERGGTGSVFASLECRNIGCDVPGSTTPWEGTPLDEQGGMNNDQLNFKLELNHSFNGVDLLALVSRRDLDRQVLQDNNGLAGDDAIVNEPFGPVIVNGTFGEVMEHESWQGEIRLTSNNDSALQWIAGAYYLKETVNGHFTFHGPFGAPVFGPGTQNVHGQVDFDYQDLTKESKAVFGNMTYDFNDRWTVAAGIRYTEDEKDMNGNAADPINGTHQIVWVPELGFNLGPGFPRAQVANPTFDDFTGRIALNWNLSGDSIAYGSYSRGYKSGGYNRGNDDGTSGDPSISNLTLYQPETVDAFEVGYKTTLQGGRARINMAAFFNDYTDKVEQSGTFVNGQPTVTAVNASDVEIYGFELESSFLYGDSGGRVDFNLGWLDATYVDFQNLPDWDLSPNPTKDVSGEPVHNAPEWNVLLNWVPVEWEVVNGTLTPMLTFTYKSSYITHPQGNFIDEQGSFTRSNASLYWESNDNGFYGEAYVHNIEDENILSSGSCGNSTFTSSIIRCNVRYQDPRTYGVRVGYRF